MYKCQSGKTNNLLLTITFTLLIIFRKIPFYFSVFSHFDIFNIFMNDSDITLNFKKKQDQQWKAAFNERNPHKTQQEEPVARSPGGTQTKTGQGTRHITDKPITKMTNKL
jgi:hypothetical protein